MALAATTIATAIAGLSITGVKSIRDLDGIPDEVDTRACPIIFPDPGNWLGAGTQSIDENTFGGPSERMYIVHRSFSYVFLYREAGDGRGLKSHYSGASTMMDAIVTAFTALDVSGVDVESVTHSQFGTVQDPSGKFFFGSFFTLTLRERINA